VRIFALLTIQSHVSFFARYSVPPLYQHLSLSEPMSFPFLFTLMFWFDLAPSLRVKPSFNSFLFLALSFGEVKSILKCSRTPKLFFFFFFFFFSPPPPGDLPNCMRLCFLESVLPFSALAFHSSRVCLWTTFSMIFFFFNPTKSDDKFAGILVPQTGFFLLQSNPTFFPALSLSSSYRTFAFVCPFTWVKRPSKG